MAVLWRDRGPRFLCEHPTFKGWAWTVGIATPLLAAVVVPNLLHPT